MNYKMIGRFSAQMLAIEAVFMLPAFLICLLDQTEKRSQSLITANAFLASILIMAAVAGVLFLFSRKATKDFYATEGMVSVSVGWLLMSLLGCLPFCLSGEFPSYIDAFFEMVSGFTTTGSSVMKNVEGLTNGVLYWRSFSNWLGGMGVLVFLLALVPAGGQNKGFTMHLLRAESPGPDVGKLTPKMRTTAMALYLIYIIMTVICFIFLVFDPKMSFFEAVCTAFSTAGTGGFGIKNDSFASFSPYVQIVCTVFMLLFGVNFSCYYLLLLGKIKSVLKDEELRLYGVIVFGSIALITLNIYNKIDSMTNVGDALRHSAFQVASIISTCGFASADFDMWPTFSKAILLLLMVTGACAGSTAGGLKCARVLLLFKSLRRNIAQVLKPQEVQTVRINGRPMDERILANTNTYLVAYVIILVISFLVVSLDNFSPMTNFSAVLSCFNNIGPGLEAVGPSCTFKDYSILSKIVLCLDMLAGRLEIFPILALFSFKAYRKG